MLLCQDYTYELHGLCINNNMRMDANQFAVIIMNFPLTLEIEYINTFL